MRKLSIILIIAGVLVMLIPVAGKYYVQYREDRMIDEWLNSGDITIAEDNPEDPEEAMEQLQDAFAGEGPGVDSTEASAESTEVITPEDRKTLDLGEQKVLGIIKINKIDLKYPVIEGVKAANLRAGIGHMPGTAGIGQPGNCALAGHRNYTFGRFFNRLDEVKIGDEITLITKTHQYKYRVYDKLVVKPTDTSVIKGGKDDSILTLITCTPIYVATHRLIVHARLESAVQTQP